ncbi:MAG TPA: protein translocase subunit SecD [Pirellulales bacterium]|nr:protein translocase subunit SecD [Pirellulales bacterium]
MAVALLPAMAVAQEAADKVGPVTVKVTTPDAATGNAVTRSILINTGIAVGLIVGSIALGTWIAKRTRLPDHGTRFSVVIFAVAASLLVTILGWPPRLGIDLRGGVILIYDIDKSQTHEGQQQLDAMTIDKLVGAVSKRVNPGGILEVTVRPYGVGQIEIIIPEPRKTGAEGENDSAQTSGELDRIKNKISTSGALEFRIVADRRSASDAAIMAKAAELDVGKSDVVETGRDGVQELVARWTPLYRADEARSYEGDPEIAARRSRRGELEVLVLIEPKDRTVTGDYLRNASSGFDQTGHPSIHFSFDARGATLFGDLTSSNLPQGDFKRRLAILLDGRLVTAPSINSAIYDRGEITGRFTQEEASDLAEILTAGQLPATLRHEPTSSMVIGPTLGADTIAKGVKSMLIATAVVVVFMLIYYRFAGLVANLAVILNVLLTVAFMIMFKAAFTLSGLAGLALTVGMAVDANVLIYERMREELARGATLRMAIRNGFERATTTIVDANVTTLISAVVLYAIGTDQVKGFAVTLILGIVMNLFTAITVSRAIFDVAEKMRWITNLRMMQIMTGANYDFIGKRRLAIALSVIVIAIGMAGVAVRGKGLLDIDFTGGVSVETLFDRAHAQDVSLVRSKLEAHADVLPDLTVQDVHISSEPPGIRFLVITSNPSEEDVEREIQNVFRGELAYNHVKLVSSETIPAQATTPEANGVQPEKEPGAAQPEKKQGAALPKDDTVDENALAFADDAAKAAAAKADELKTDDTAKPVEPAKSTETKAVDASKTEPKAQQKAGEDEKKGAPKATDATPSDPFAGGTMAHLRFDQPISHDALQGLIHDALKANPATADAAVDLSSADYEPGMERALAQWDAKIAAPQREVEPMVTKIQQELAEEPFFPSSNKIGAAVATNTQEQAIVALVASIVLIMIYVWFRFTQVIFGLSVIVALVHDVLVTLGALAVSYWLAPYLGFAGVEQFKINLPIIAAFLTIIGYSLNDTIVIFDRIREIRGKSPELSAALVNTSINQTLSRTLLTSLTVFLVVVILYAVGGQGIHGFAFALVIGTISGTYSTIYIATPALIWLGSMSHRAQAGAQVPRRTPQASASR